MNDLDLMKTFAPLVRLHPDEIYNPSSIPWFLEKVSLWYGDIALSHKLESAPITKDKLLKHSNKSNLYFKVDSDKTLRGEDIKNNQSTSECYGHVIKGTSVAVLQYFFFYAYDDVVLSSWIPIIKNWTHEGDWEGVNVYIQAKNGQFNAKSKIIGIGRFQHGSILSDVKGIGFYEETHPIIYSAKGTHASYKQAGSFRYGTDSCKDGGAEWRCWDHVVDITSDDNEWWNDDVTVRWGSSIKVKLKSNPFSYNSPKSPAKQHKMWWTKEPDFTNIFDDVAIRDISDIDPKTSYAPAAIQIQNNILLLYTGKDTQNGYLYWTLYDGTSWSGNKRILASNRILKTSDGPSVAITRSAGSIATMFFKQRTSNCINQIEISLDDSGQIIFGETQSLPSSIESNLRPAAAFYNGKIFLVFKGKDTDELYCASKFADEDDNTWEVERIKDMPGDISPESNKTVALLAFDSKLVMIRKHKNDKLYLSYFDGSRWFGDCKIDGAKTDKSPHLFINSSNNLILVYRKDSKKMFQKKYISIERNEWEKEEKMGDEKSSNDPTALLYDDGIRRFDLLFFRGFDKDDIRLSSIDSI